MGGGFETVAIALLLSASISDGSDDADKERETLRIDAEEQKSPALIGERVVGPSCLVS